MKLSWNERLGWIGVDLDGTLAHYDGWKGHEHIGPPVPAMLERIKDWIAEGQEVRIFTARASDADQMHHVMAYLDDIGIGGLLVTNVKDFQMRALYDDRAFHVVPNKGIVFDPDHVAMMEADLATKEGMILQSVPKPRTAKELNAIIWEWLGRDGDWGEFEKELAAVLEKTEAKAA